MSSDEATLIRLWREKWGEAWATTCGVEPPGGRGTVLVDEYHAGTMGAAGGQVVRHDYCSSCLRIEVQIHPRHRCR
jgi:hypothetical protein